MRLQKIADAVIFILLLMCFSISMICLPISDGYAAAKAMNANKVIYGNIVTMNEQQPRAEAMAIQDGKIVFVGTKDDAQAFLDKDTEVVDFGSEVVYPGMIDAHSHLGLLTSIMGGGPRFLWGDSYEDNVRDMTEFIKANPGREIYKAYGFTSDSVRGVPSHELLDGIEIDGKKFDKPIVIAEVSGHLCWLNKAAMEKFGVNKEMVKRYGESVVPCDANGEPIGCVKETPHFAIFNTLPLEREEAKEIILQMQGSHLESGYSMVGDCGINEGPNPMVTAMGELAQEGRLKQKVRAYYQIFETCEEPLREVDRAVEYAKQYNSDSFKIVGIKIFLDGVNEGLSSWSLNPYKHYQFQGKAYSGYKRWDYDRIDELAEIIRKANANGLSMQFHAYGSGSARYALDAIEKAQAGIEQPDFRNAVSHLLCVDKEDLPRFAKLNVIPTVAPQWYIFVPQSIEFEKMIYGNPETDKELDGNGYLDMGYLQSYLDTGANMVFHSDGDDNVNPSIVFFCAVNKYDAYHAPDMKPRNIKERMSAYDAVKCFTVNSAYALHEEANVGTLEIGKQADFVVFDADFTDDTVMADPKVCGIPPKALYINGEKIY